MSKGAYKQQQLAGQPLKGGASRKCPQCGKEFFPTTHWAYRNNKTVWCSWKCLRENEAGIPPHKETQEPARPLTEEQMARLAEVDAHEKRMAETISIPPSLEKRAEAEKKRRESRAKKEGQAKEGTEGARPDLPWHFRNERTERMARDAYEAIQAGPEAVKALAEARGSTVQTLYSVAARYRKAYGLPTLPVAERQRRCGQGNKDHNRSGEITARLAAVMGRCRRLLDEIREEAEIGA